MFGDDYDGLLTPDDRWSALGAGLRGFGAGILGQGYSPMPRSRFQGLGQGFAQAGAVYDNALTNAAQRRLLMKREDRAEREFDFRQGEAARRAKIDEASLAKMQREAEREDRTLRLQEEASAAIGRAIAEGRDPYTDPQVQAVLARMNPAQGLDLFRKGDETAILSEGGKLVHKRTGKVIADNPKRETGFPGPFQGTGMDQQVMNILLTGDPASAAYAAAYAHMSNPRYDLASGQMIKPDMSAFRPPGRAAPASPVVPAPTDQQAQPAGPKVERIPGFEPKMTEGQAASALYADRMSEANRILDEVEMEGAKPGQRFLEKYTPEMIRSYALTPEYQRFEQARRDFINATLRRESGAVISEPEFKNAERQYFPVPGDSPEVIAQKRANRQTAMEGIARAAGPAYKAPAPKEKAKPAVDYKAKYGLD